MGDHLIGAELVKSKAREAWKANAGSVPDIFVLRLLKEDAESTTSSAPKKWSARKTLLFTVATCGTFWALFLYFVFR
jgi:hypothetical protein